MVQILRFAPSPPRASDWSQRELSEFYRVEGALTQAGIALEIERGLTDEGDPWFTFCRRDTGEVFVHFARIDGEYIIDGTGFIGVARGRDFSALVRRLISGEALQLAKLRPANSNVFLHPAALLIALVGAAFFHSGEAKAAESAVAKPESRRASGFSLILQDRGAGASPLLGLDAAQAATVMAGVLIGIDEQRLLPASPGLTLPTPSAPSTSFTAILASEGMHNDPARAAALALPPAPPPDASAVIPPLSVLTSGLATTAPPPADSDLVRLSGLMLPADPANIAVTALLAVGPPQPAATPLYFVALDPSALPADEAGLTVRALSSSSDAHVIGLADKLPALIEQLIRNGSHLASTSTSTSTPAPTLASIPTTAPAPAPAPADPASSVPAPPSAIPSVAAPPLAAHHNPAIDQAVAAFMSAVVHWSVMVNGQDVVIYDADIFGPHGSSLDSVTFAFSDGSSISLVGTAPELVGAHLVH